MNDLLRTDVLTRHSPETVAAACIYLAARVRRVPLPSKPAWYQMFGVRELVLRDIARQVLQLYRRASKPDAVALELRVEQLRGRQQEQRWKSRLLSGTGASHPGAVVSTFSPADSNHNSPVEATAAHNHAGADQTSVAQPLSAAASAALQLASSESPSFRRSGVKQRDHHHHHQGATNGDTRVDKENLETSRHGARSASHSSPEENGTRLRSKHNNRDRSRHSSRSPKRRRRSVSAQSRSPRRRDTKHKRSKDRRGGSKSHRDRSLSPSVDRHRSKRRDHHKSSRR